jgi:hypothetical protein
MIIHLLFLPTDGEDQIHFVIEAEPDFNILIRILTRVARHRIVVQEMHTAFMRIKIFKTFAITLSEPKKMPCGFQKGLNKEIEVHSVKILEQIHRDMLQEIDLLPKTLIESGCLTKHHLLQLAGVNKIPDVDTSFSDIVVENSLALLNGTFKDKRLLQHAARLLDKGKVDDAWQVLLRCHEIKKQCN